MSVRAYRINKIDRANKSTLNCWGDGQLLDFLLEAGEDGVGAWRTDGEDGIRQFEVSVDRLKEAIKAIKRGEFDSDYKDDTSIEETKKYLISSLQRDINWAKKKKEDYILYDCY